MQKEGKGEMKHKTVLQNSLNTLHWACYAILAKFQLILFALIPTFGSITLPMLPQAIP